jgi:hypothetical protein
MRIKSVNALLGALTATTFAAGLLVSGAAGGQPYHSTGITMKPAWPGERVSITAQGFKPNATVTFLISRSACAHTSCSDIPFYTLGRARTNANGVATDKATIPSGFRAGSRHILKVQGPGAAGSFVYSSISLTLK